MQENIYTYNIKLLDDTKIKLIKGLAAGQDTAQLLLIAIQGIDLLQGNTALYEYTRGMYSTVYTDILKNKGTMQIEYKEALKRLERLENTKPKSREEQQRIKVAINEHNRIITEYKKHLAIEI